MRRIVLLVTLALEGLCGVFGGILLVISPDGHLMQMPVEIMHDVFPNFLIPGLILTGMGVLTLIAFLAVLRKSRAGWVMAELALVGFAIWLAVEIFILRELHFLHVVWGVLVFVGIWAAFPFNFYSKKVKPVRT